MAGCAVFTEIWEAQQEARKWRDIATNADMQILYAQFVLDAERMLRKHQTKCIHCRCEAA